VRLEIQPEFRAVTEIQTETDRGMGGDPATVVDDLGDPIRRNTDSLCELVLRQAYSARNSSFSISPGATGANSSFIELSQW
jgi:hypothetical protein